MGLHGKLTKEGLQGQVYSKSETHFCHYFRRRTTTVQGSKDIADNILPASEKDPQ